MLGNSRSSAVIFFVWRGISNITHNWTTRKIPMMKKNPRSVKGFVIRNTYSLVSWVSWSWLSSTSTGYLPALLRHVSRWYRLSFYHAWDSALSTEQLAKNILHTKLPLSCCLCLSDHSVVGAFIHKNTERTRWLIIELFPAWIGRHAKTRFDSMYLRHMSAFWSAYVLSPHDRPQHSSWMWLHEPSKPANTCQVFGLHNHPVGTMQRNVSLHTKTLPQT